MRLSYDEWMRRPAFLVVGKRADERAGSGYVALWLDTAIFEPLWAVFYNEAEIARNITGITGMAQEGIRISSYRHV